MNFHALKHGQTAIGLTCALSVMLVSCASTGESTPSGTDALETNAQEAAPLAPANAKDLEAELSSIVESIQSTYGGEVGIAIYSNDGLIAAGDKGMGPAWSSIKVPIAIAAREHGASRDLVDMAIKQSDNDAAFALWQMLDYETGSAANAVEQLLEEHDSRALIDAYQFGYSVWPLADQARFALDLQCMDEARYVFGSMNHLVDWQQWGLSKLDRSRAKGGWGLQEETGLYTHRQVGVIGLGGGTVGVALSVVLDAEFDAAHHEGLVEDHASEAIDELAQKVHAAATAAYDSGELKVKPVCIRERKTQSTSESPTSTSSSTSTSTSTSASTLTSTSTSASKNEPSSERRQESATNAGKKGDSED